MAKSTKTQERLLKNKIEELRRLSAVPDNLPLLSGLVLRSLLRAVGAQSPTSSVTRAAAEMRFVLDCLRRFDELPTVETILVGAVDDLRANLSNVHKGEREAVEAALKGLMFLVERSCDDNLAPGRASRRLAEFRQAALDAFGRRP